MPSTPASPTPSACLTAALYLFVDLPDCAALREPLQALCDAEGVRGMLLLAPEGINGTIAGRPEGVQAVLAWLRSDPRLARLQHKEAWGERQPFYRMRVRLKREIVTLGVPGLQPALHAGTYVKPEDWNALIDDPEVVVIDVRNDYEIGIGSFRRAVNPGTRSFTEFPAWVDAERRPGGLLAGQPRVAMFCTGGIRCEKSTALLKSQGFGEVYHLEGGILKYLETVPEDDSRWHGDCFVFDERVSVGHGLVPGHHRLCRSCRMPLGAQELASPLYEAGVSCPHCHGSRTPEQLQALRERERQMRLAAERGQEHIGAKLPSTPPTTAARAADALPRSLPVLYSFRRCPYAMRARLALAASGQACELREVVLRDKPAALLAASPKGTVPVLVLPGGGDGEGGDTVIDQSLDIMRWAMQRSDPGRWLQPSTGEPLQAMLDLVAACDGTFKQALDRCKYPGRYPDLEAGTPGNAAAWATAEGWIAQALESRLATRDWLFGSHATLADMAVAPFVRQFAGIDAARWEAGAWPRTRQWLAGWQALPLFDAVMDKYPAWREGDAPVIFACA